MRIVFLGTPQFAIPSLKKLIHHPYFEVTSVVTQPDKRRGRGNQLIPSPVKKLAISHQIPVWQPKRIKKDAETLTHLEQIQADVFVVVAYGQILSQQILGMPKLGCVNVHGSILPKYRGAAPIQWSIYHGDKETGITTMLMDEGMDTGAMLLKAFTPIHLLDNAEYLAEILAQQGADLLIETLFQLESGKVSPTPQNAENATYAPLIQKSDYVIDWSRSNIEIHHQVRAFYPNCITPFRESPLKVLETVPLGEAYWTQLPSDYQILQQHWQNINTLKGQVGEVVHIIKKWGAVIQTGKGLLLLKQVQPSGKRPQSGWDFVNGSRLTVGEILSNERIISFKRQEN